MASSAEQRRAPRKACASAPEQWAASLRRSLAGGSPAIERLALADTTVCLRVAEADAGLTLLMDRSPVDVVDGCQPSEIEISLSASALDAFLSGRLLLQRAVIHGDVRSTGPLWKFLRVAPILASVLGAAEQPAASNGHAHTDPVRGRLRTVAADPALCAIECRGVRKSFGASVVLDGVDLEIPEGLITTIIGPSGTGKSVLLKNLIGLMRPDGGDVLIRGQSLGRLSLDDVLRLRTSCGVMFQDGALWTSMSLYDNVAFPLRQHTDLTEPEIEQIVRARLAEVGLADASERMPNELSGGMRKRAGLARAMVLEPEILLFDEPDSGLDPVRTALLCDLISDVHAHHGGTFVVITHNIGVVRQIAQYVAALWKGHIVAAGFTADLFASRDPFVSQFLEGEALGPLGMD